MFEASMLIQAQIQQSRSLSVQEAASTKRRKFVPEERKTDIALAVDLNKCLAFF